MPRLAGGGGTPARQEGTPVRPNPNPTDMKVIVRVRPSSREEVCASDDRRSPFTPPHGRLNARSYV